MIDKLDALEKACLAAHPHPLHIERIKQPLGPPVFLVQDADKALVADVTTRLDAEFFVLARASVLDLIAEVRRLRDVEKCHNDLCVWKGDE